MKTRIYILLTFKLLSLCVLGYNFNLDLSNVNNYSKNLINSSNNESVNNFKSNDTLLNLFTSKKNKISNQNDTLTYLFMGHIYQWGSGGNRVDYRVESIDFNQFDGIWLGGDICSETSLNYSTVEYVDNLFDLGNQNNHWTLGNHDVRNGNIEWIKNFTNRPTYYASYNNGLTIVVLNTNLSPLDCENIDKQFKMIKNVCDTISHGHLIFIAHHGIYQNVPGVKDPSEYAHSSLKNWLGNCYSESGDYLNTIYPLIVEVENRGVQVKHIMGDVGTHTKSYYGISEDGVEYFGSGINNSYNLHNGTDITNADLLLIFKHVISTNELFWEFIELNDF